MLGRPPCNQVGVGGLAVGTYRTRTRGFTLNTETVETIEIAGNVGPKKPPISGWAKVGKVLDYLVRGVTALALLLSLPITAFVALMAFANISNLKSVDTLVFLLILLVAALVFCLIICSCFAPQVIARPFARLGKWSGAIGRLPAYVAAVVLLSRLILR
jgi:hypothetical protein